MATAAKRHRPLCASRNEEVRDAFQQLHRFMEAQPDFTRMPDERARLFGSHCYESNYALVQIRCFREEDDPWGVELKGADRTFVQGVDVKALQWVLESAKKTLKFSDDTAA